VPADPVEQFDLKFVLKRRNRVAGCRLRKIKITRGVREVLALATATKTLS
jgi:hypothetical protein